MDAPPPRPLKRFLLTIAIYIFAILSPNLVYSVSFSFLLDMFGDKASADVIDDSVSLNSQNISLLHATVNSDPHPNTYLTDGPLALGNALVAEIGPSGTVSDVESQFSTQISMYTVRSGDTLSEIAEMFGVSVNTVMWANELDKADSIQPGQVLVILPISGIRYTVKSGDTIQGIVLRHKGNLEEVLQFNDLTLDSVIRSGDVITIPDAEPTANTSKLASSRSTSNKSSGTSYPGYYIRPVSGGTKTQGIHGNNAVDLAAPVGTVIRASASGKVIASLSNGAWNGGYGNYVIISHSNNTYTLYAHTQKNFVSAGDIVEQGQMIAKIGMTGKTTGPHVHFEIRGAKNPF